MLPSKIKLIKNFIKAIFKHALDAGKNVTADEYMTRLEVCNGCEMRLDNRCTHIDCGCFLDKKAWWESEDCPLKKWSKLILKDNNMNIKNKENEEFNKNENKNPDEYIGNISRIEEIEKTENIIDDYYAELEKENKEQYEQH